MKDLTRQFSAKLGSTEGVIVKEEIYEKNIDGLDSRIF